MLGDSPLRCGAQAQSEVAGRNATAVIDNLVMRSRAITAR